MAVALLVTLPVASACSEIECKDEDGDGYGEGCQAGPDCDDGDPSRVQACDLESVDCEAEPEARGCLCTGSGTRACYLGPDGTEGVGTCRGGRHFCNQGRWTRCDGLVMPGTESCNGEDDDCDGLVDERVQSPCGGCDPTCLGEVWGGDFAPFVGDAPLALTEARGLTLQRLRNEHRTVWVANTDEGTVSRIDARDAVEVARYRVGEGTVYPERVAVDYVGDAWILSEAAAGGTELTKIAGSDERCRDADTDGVVTSAGPEDVLSFGEDDCVVLHVPVASAGPGSLAIDGTRVRDGFQGGHPWVGLASGELVQVDGRDGAVIRSVELEDIVPYSATFDALGQQWILDRGGVLARVRVGGPAPVTDVFRSALPCFTLDSFVVDAAGELYLTGFACENVISFDPVRLRWDEVLTEGVLSTRGIVLVDDGAWVVHTAGAMSPVSRQPFGFGPSHSLAFAALEPLDSASAAVDSDGQVWVVSRVGGDRGAGVVTRFDPAVQTPTAEVSVGLGPRSQGDFTGNALSGSFAPEGAERHVFRGCSAGVDASVGTIWRRLHVTSEVGEGARIEIAIRHGGDAAILEAADFTRLATLPGDQSPLALDLPVGGQVEVELHLVSEHHVGAPRVAEVGLEWQCPGPQ